MSTLLWNLFPNEMKLAVVDELDFCDVRALSMADKRTYEICVPVTFKSIKLRNLQQLEQFLDSVPRQYCQYVLELDLCTQHEEWQDRTSYHAPRSQTDAVISLLLACRRLKKLALRMFGSLDKSIITPFTHLWDLKQLTIANCAAEEDYPLSERLVVSIAASIPKLEDLTLDKISRSRLHAPDLNGVYPFVPVVIGDDDIPHHPSLGWNLSLPSLLSISTLRKLVIRDTHLGDPLWSTADIRCHLEVLDLGSCYYQNEDYNRICTERIMAAVGRTVDEFSLTTSVSDTVFSKPSATPLPRLRKLHISPFFPVNNVVDTISNLAGSPIETLSMQCYEDDVVDVCSALEEFLNRRVERGPEFYHYLKRIDVSVAVMDDSRGDPEEEGRMVAARRLQDYCRDLQLASLVSKMADVPGLPAQVGRTVTAPETCERLNLLHLQ